MVNVSGVQGTSPLYVMVRLERNEEDGMDKREVCGGIDEQWSRNSLSNKETVTTSHRQQDDIELLLLSMESLCPIVAIETVAI